MVLQPEVTLFDSVIPMMTWEDRYKYLGVLLGPNPETCLDELASEFRDNVEKLFQSCLADWMKLEAYKVFFMAKLDYALRSTLAHKKWALKLDRFVRSTVKRSLGLPGRVCDAFYVPTVQGGVGLKSIEDDLGNLIITHAVKMLTSPDNFFRVVAIHSLDMTIKKRYGQTNGPEDRWRFLANQLRIAHEGRKGDISMIWSRVRDFVREIGVRLHGGTDQNLSPSSISVGDEALPEHFCKVFLRVLCATRATAWLKSGLHLANRGLMPTPSAKQLTLTIGSETAVSCGIESTDLL